MRYASTRYNQVRQKSIHNAYQRDELIEDQVFAWGVRSLELDLHGSGRDWKVYHWLLDPKTTVERLSDGLALFRRIHRKDPEHDVITVFLDLKTPFSGQRLRGLRRPRKGRMRERRGGRYTANRLDNLIREHLAEKWLFTPARLRRALPEAWSLQEVAARPEAWPKLPRLRGRFLFVLTGPRVRLEHYRRSARDPVAFIAPRIGKAAQIDASRHAVFFNLADGKARRNLGRELLRRGLVSRSYGLNTPKRWKHAVETRIHHLATDKVDDVEDPWASTHTGKVPFQLI